MTCHVGLCFLSNSFFMYAATSFSMLYLARAWDAMSTASCCISSDISAFLITAFLCSVILALFQLFFLAFPGDQTWWRREVGLGHQPFVVVKSPKIGAKLSRIKI